MLQYISADTGIQDPERLRQAASERKVRVFKSYREAELHGYYSLRRLKELGLFVPDFMRPYYECVVETRYGNRSVYSRKQAREIYAACPVLDVRSPDPIGLSLPEPDSAGVEILLRSEERTAADVPAALCGQNLALPDLISQSQPKKRRTRGRAKPRSTGYFIDTPEELEVPESHEDVENEIRLILHVVKSGIDQHRHRVEGMGALQPSFGTEAHGRVRRVQGVPLVAR